jgi:hypothetical protein
MYKFDEMFPSSLHSAGNGGGGACVWHQIWQCNLFMCRLGRK